MKQKTRVNSNKNKPSSRFGGFVVIARRFLRGGFEAGAAELE
jgi:hypothetical protein